MTQNQVRPVADNAAPAERTYSFTVESNLSELTQKIGQINRLLFEVENFELKFTLAHPESSQVLPDC